MSDLKQTALACLKMGWFVFPLGEKSKAPDGALAPNGFQSASNDPKQIEAWWDASPKANIGIDLGHSNLTVLDFDNGKPPAELGLENCFQVSTSRGTHVYLSGITKQGDMHFHGEHVGEIKSAGGYVLAPKSIHPTGAVYKLAVKTEIAPPPGGLIERLRPASKPSPTLDGGKIPYGQHDKELTRIAGKLRQLGLEYDAIYSAIVEVCEKRCERYGSDYREMCEKIATSICKYPAGSPFVHFDLSAAKATNPAAVPTNIADWRSQFRSVNEMEEGDVVMVIDGVLQEGICFIGANPADGKTLVALSFAKAISSGEPLFGLPQFAVPVARQVIYLIPESRDRAFRKRCEAFRITNDKSKFMARTISVGAPLQLSDPYLLEAVKETKPVVFLDTAARFMKGTDENSAAQNRELVNDVIALLSAGAVSVILVHHATKAAKANREVMTLENMLRGSSDLGAMCDQAYGIRKDMGLYANGSGPMEIELVNLKDREQIGGLTTIRLAASFKQEGAIGTQSYINQGGNFRVMGDTESWKRTVDSLVDMVKADPNVPEKELASQTKMSAYAIKKELNRRGWHRVQGGKGGASPWHQDSGRPCPYTKSLPIPASPTVN